MRRADGAGGVVRPVSARTVVTAGERNASRGSARQPCARRSAAPRAGRAAGAAWRCRGAVGRRTRRRRRCSDVLRRGVNVAEEPLERARFVEGAPPPERKAKPATSAATSVANVTETRTVRQSSSVSGRPSRLRCSRQSAASSASARAARSLASARPRSIWKAACAPSGIRGHALMRAGAASAIASSAARAAPSTKPACTGASIATNGRSKVGPPRSAGACGKANARSAGTKQSSSR